MGTVSGGSQSEVNVEKTVKVLTLTAVGVGTGPHGHHQVMGGVGETFTVLVGDPRDCGIRLSRVTIGRVPVAVKTGPHGHHQIGGVGVGLC